MNLLSHSFGENRLLNVSRRSIVSAAEERNQVRAAQVMAAQVPQVGATGNFSTTGVLPNYNINLDPTYSGTIGPETGYTGTPQTAGNVGPTAGESWTGGVSGGVVKTPFQSVLQRAQAAGDAAAAQPGFTEDKLRARQAAEANVYAQAQIEQQAQQATTDTATRQMAQGAGAETLGNSATNFSNNQLTKRLNMSTGDRQAYIEKRRAEGVTDQQIRTELASGTVQFTPTQPIAPTTPTNALPSTETAGTSTPSPTTTETPTQQEKTSTDTKGTTTQAPVPNRNANVLRQLATLETDPLTQIYLNAEADRLDVMQTADPMSQGAFNQTQDTSTFDAIGTILDRADARARESKASTQSFLQGQIDRTNAYNAAQQENLNNQLTFANQKAVRDQSDANKKMIDSQTIMLALQGGFGSADGNREIAEARLKGEEAIIDLNKEYGFKKTDIGLHFTDLSNKAFDNYQIGWLNATDTFETKVSNLDIQGISNQGAKASALTSAYKTYVSDIKTAREAHAKGLTDALKYVQTEHNSLKDDKRADDKEKYNRSWEEFKFEQDQIYKYDALEQTKLLREDARDATEASREEARDIKRDDKEKYNTDTIRSGLISKIEGNDVLAQFKVARSSWEAFEAAFDQEGNPFRDRALAKSYEKLVETNSIVMPGEYEAIAKNVPLANKIFGKFKQVAEGGESWTNKEREDLRELSKGLFEAHEKRRIEESHIFNAAIQYHNKVTANPMYHLSPSEFNLPESTSTNQMQDFQKLLPSGYQSPFGSPSAPSTENPPKLQSGVFDGRKVTLAPIAFNAFKSASEDFQRDYGSEIRISAVALSSYRDQSATIKSMADRLGVPFNSSNPNATAAVLREKGHPVANIGGSKHEKGLAIDLYPGEIKIGDKRMTAHEYISLVKPYLEKYGIKQMNHQGNDPGNFEYFPTV